VRSDLEKIPGIKEITTDFTTNIATFKAPTPQDELKKKLDEFAKTNEHMKGWTFMDKPAGKEGTEKSSGT
jgi:hypothetical protein